MIGPVVIVFLAVFLCVYAVIALFNGKYETEVFARVDMQNETAVFARVDIPFYMYSEEFVPFLQKCLNRSKRENLANHYGETQFLEDLENHQWRVKDPEEAVIFVVPIPLLSISRNKCATGEELKWAVEAIKNSKYFERNLGWDHLLVGTHYQVHRSMPEVLQRIAQNFTVGHKGTFRNSPWRCTIPTPHAPSSRNPPSDIQTLEEYKNRPYTFFFQGQTKDNPGYKIRRRAMEKIPGFMSPNILVSVSKFSDPPYPYCNVSDVSHGNLGNLEGCTEKQSQLFHERISQAKYDLFFRGDDFASARMYDALWSGTINIAFSDQIWNRGLPSQCQVPWEELVIKGEEKEFMADPIQTLQKLVGNISDQEIGVRLSAMEKFSADVVWGYPNGRLTTNILFNTARRCIPERILEGHNIDRSSLLCPFEDPSLTFLA